MKVFQIMRSEPRTCAPDDTAAAAGRLMAEVDCGWLPVVDDHRVIGVVTDRDLCLALARSDRKPSDVKVGDAMTSRVHACGPDDDVRAALTVMREHHVRRLPVLGERECLEGVLSLDDTVFEARPFETAGFTGPFYADITATLRSILERPALTTTA